MDNLRHLIGVEHSVTDVSRTLRRSVEGLGAPEVGALHVTCADETEFECAHAFQSEFADHVLPDLKGGERAAMRIANLGARYEWGAVRIAENHYATPPTRDSGKLMVVKINAHVAADRDGAELRFGTLRRYETDSPCCGALAATLAGAPLPAAAQLREALTADDTDRIAMLLDEDVVPPRLRSLYAAMVSAGLQARTAVADIVEYHPDTPTQYVVLPCVTINRAGLDTEIVCGVHTTVDHQRPTHLPYVGVGTDPRLYRFEDADGGFRVLDGP